MEDERCMVEVGTHESPYWRNKIGWQNIVCSRHKAQYEERPELGPYDWEEIK